MDKVEICENCKHYKQHYYWLDGGLNMTHSGHCFEHGRMRLVFYKDYCDIWAPVENINIPPDETIESILRRAVKQITDIAAILKIRSR